jgi:hypothetical protein
MSFRDAIRQEVSGETGIIPRVSTKTAARISGIPVDVIRNAIRRGELHADRIGPVFIGIKIADLRAWLDAAPSAQAPAAVRDPRRNGRKPTGRPPKARRSPGRPRKVTSAAGAMADGETGGGK